MSNVMPLNHAPQLSISPLTLADTRALIALRLKVAAESEVAMGCTFEEEAARPVERFEQQLASSLGVAFGAFTSGQLIGTASVIRPNELGSSAHKATLWGVLVHPGHRRQSVGRRLVETCIQHTLAGGAHRINLTVYSSSKAAISLYHSMGFVPYGREPQAICIKGCYYDAVLMSLAIAGQR